MSRPANRPGSRKPQPLILSPGICLPFFQTTPLWRYAMAQKSSTRPQVREKTSATKEYICPKCKKVCRTEGWLGYHLRTFHKDQESSPSPLPHAGAGARVIPASEEYPVQVFLECPNCGNGIIYHMTTQWEPRTVKCEACDRIMAFGAWRMWAFGSPLMAPRAERQKERGD